AVLVARHERRLFSYQIQHGRAHGQHAGPDARLWNRMVEIGMERRQWACALAFALRNLLGCDGAEEVHEDRHSFSAVTAKVLSSHDRRPFEYLIGAEYVSEQSHRFSRQVAVVQESRGEFAGVHLDS